MTTNERLNAYRYKHFQTAEPGVIRSPFKLVVLPIVFNLPTTV